MIAAARQANGETAAAGPMPAALFEQLSALARSGQRLLFLHHAHRVLANYPEAPELARLTLATLVELGLGGPARELCSLRRDLPCHRGSDAVPGDDAGLPESLARLPSGRASWSQLRDAYAHNLAALAGRGGWVEAACARGSAALASVQLFRTRDGLPAPATRRPGALREWWPPFSTVEEEHRFALPARGELGPTAIVGVRHGNIVREVLRRTQAVLLQHSHAIFVVEPDESRFAAWLHVDDASEVLAEERVGLFVGSGAVAAFERALRDEADLPTPTHFLNLSHDAALFESVRAAAARVEHERQASLVRLCGALAERYRDRDARYWASRWRRPATALGLTSRFTTMLQYSTRDALAALEAMGCRTHTCIERRDHHRLSPITIAQALLEHDPDLILTLDHLRYEHAMLPANVPFLCWTQDPMANLLCRRAGESIGPLDFVCGFYRPRCVEEFGYPPDRYLSVKVPVCTRHFHDAPLDAPTRARLAADVCFVSHASRPIDEIYRDAAREYPAGLHPLLDALYRRVLDLLAGDGSLDFETTAMELMRATLRECGCTMAPAAAEHVKTHFLYRLFDWGRRQQTLEWVASWARRTGRVFRIYGKGWERHPTLAAFACGPLAHGEPLRAAYRASTLALQLLPSGFLHQRSFEAIASGALPLTRFCPDSDDFGGLDLDEARRRLAAREPLPGTIGFLPVLERIVFRTPQEFESLAERFLGDADDAARVQRQLREVVLREFTYDAVMRRVMAAFRERIEAAASGT